MKEIVSKRDLLLRSLIGHFDGGRPGALLGELNSALPREAKERLSLAPVVKIDGALLSFGVSGALEAMHSSWVAELLAEENPPIQNLIISALPPGLRLPLEKGRGTAVRAEGSYGVMGRALLERLYRHLDIEEVVPVPLLPPSTLNELLTLDQPLLVRVIGVLGLYEIAAVLRRQIVPAVHKSVLRLLTEGEISQLRRSLQQQDILPPPKIDLARWTSSRRRLYHLLQLRGLIRLSYCLAHAHPSLIWQLAHRLDVGRGKTLASGRREVSPELERRLVDQLLGLVHQLKGGAP